jgi:hypothetical protein
MNWKQYETVSSSSDKVYASKPREIAVYFVVFMGTEEGLHDGFPLGH